MVKIRRNDARELAWTVVGASSGSIARHWFDPIWPRSTVSTLALVSVSATAIGCTLVASRRTAAATALVSAAGAAASMSAAAVRAATSTPSPSILGIAAFLFATVAGLALGLSTASAVVKYRHQERY
jgi:hypothetical protein